MLGTSGGYIPNLRSLRSKMPNLEAIEILASQYWSTRAFLTSATSNFVYTLLRYHTARVLRGAANSNILKIEPTLPGRHSGRRQGNLLARTFGRLQLLTPFRSHTSSCCLHSRPTTWWMAPFCPESFLWLSTAKNQLPTETNRLASKWSHLSLGRVNREKDHHVGRVRANINPKVSKPNFHLWFLTTRWLKSKAIWAKIS